MEALFSKLEAEDDTLSARDGARWTPDLRGDGALDECLVKPQVRL